jgi:choline dehydrogenase-like flavoprotein
VLATGGIENARLLLASRSTRPDGLGNDHDLVGRYFMEHPHIPVAAHVACNRPSALPALFTRNLLHEGTPVHATLVPTEEWLRSARLQAAAFTVGVMAHYDRDAAVPADEWQTGDVFQVLQDLDPAGAEPAGAGRLEGWPPADAAGAHLVLGGACEQAPDPESRVVLGPERDALGMPRAQLNWRLGQGDRDSLYRVLRGIGRELGALGIGRLRPLIGPDEDWPEEVLGGNHHMGTTRMARDPKQGVVDADCKVHGIANLYIAGSSVFPTGGSANPTLTLVALALRLANHLQARLA